MQSFVEEMATLLGIQAPANVTDKETYLQLRIKQEVSSLYLKQRKTERQMQQSERISLLRSR